MSEIVRRATSYTDFKDFRSIFQIDAQYHYKEQGFDRWWKERNYRLICENIEPHSMILDLGCGDGRLEHFLPQGAKLWGIDYSFDALTVIRKHADNHYEELIVSDLRYLPFKSNCGVFDTIVCSLALMYFFEKEQQALIRNVLSLLKPAGIFIISYPNITELRRGSENSYELERHHLVELLNRERFEIVKQAPIAPFFDRNWVEKTRQNPTPDAYQTFLARCQDIENIETCYHYIIVARKN